MEKGYYEIKIPHFYCLEYSDEYRSMVLDVDFRDSEIYLNTSLIVKWNAPHENDFINDEEKEKIIKNIYDYLVYKRGFSNIVLES